MSKKKKVEPVEAVATTEVAELAPEINAEGELATVPDEVPPQKPTQGRIVLYSTGEGKTQPALVQEALTDSRVDLNVNGKGTIYFKSNVGYSLSGVAGTWHYPPRV